jgi:hypothetical protein
MLLSSSSQVGGNFSKQLQNHLERKLRRCFSGMVSSAIALHEEAQKQATVENQDKTVLKKPQPVRYIQHLIG